MWRQSSKILSLILAATLAAAGAWADSGSGDETGVLNRPPFGSLARQLSLKLQLEIAGGGSLAASLDHNRERWRMLTPEQRERFRQYAVAFLKKNASDQAKLMRQYAFFLSLSEEKKVAYRLRAMWLKKVSESLSPDERQRLKRMPPVERARILRARRDELVRQGKLDLEQLAEKAEALGEPKQPEPDK
jgi:hypothetical protein